MSRTGKIYIGSILLEMNRWAKEKNPTYAVSDWASRLAADGFDGIELWEYHATCADDAELAALAASPCPVTIFNSYAQMTDADEARRVRNAELTAKLGATGVKFNVGAEPAERDTYLRNLRQWRSMFDDDVTLLCECHPGTIIEEAADAKAFFADLDCEGVEAIVHAFNRADTLGEWFDALGQKVTHAHLQMRDGGDLVGFDHDPDCMAEALGVMKAAGFAGSMTLEFTNGTLAPDENIEGLYTAALADLANLKAALA